MVRGPSAALYGANASSGVLNLITKAPRGSEGGLVRLTGGELSTFNADLRWAGHLGGDWWGKVVGGLRQSGDFTVSRVGAAEYSVPCTATITSRLPAAGARAARPGGRRRDHVRLRRGSTATSPATRTC